MFTLEVRPWWFPFGGLGHEDMNGQTKVTHIAPRVHLTNENQNIHILIIIQ